ncbi:putative Beta-lactamase domain protein [uncultured delta proteobacterium]|uniref:Putative Beta-lactamase domain protein n=1 Tax=uncultured delta proteobacterium TaxID=34034 RepID=A0A212IT54_9DELT|nr:putative Beta-lactamase domain protein [uncultured delta proteobacterium]
MRKTIVGWLITVGMLLLGSGTAPAAPAPEPVIIGNARVTALQDMPGEMPLTIFRGADLQAMQAMVPSGRAPAGVTVFLVQLSGQNMLVDTGFGANEPERRSALPELLRRVGVGMGDIGTVLLTHMHGDHIGGLVKDGAAVFSKAVIMVSEKELAFWTDPKTVKENPGLDKNVQMVKDVQKAYGDRLKTFAFNDPVAFGLTAIAATGHTPGHTMFLLLSEDSPLLFWGDLVHAAALQFANPDICATYDMNMPEAVATRRDVFAKAARERFPVAGAHLPFPAIGRVTKKDSGGEYEFTPGL